MNNETYLSLQDLLSECFDAILYRYESNDKLDDHIYFLSKYINDFSFNEDIRIFLYKILNYISEHKLIFFNDNKEERNNLAKQIYEK